MLIENHFRLDESETVFQHRAALVEVEHSADRPDLDDREHRDDDIGVITREHRDHVTAPDALAGEEIREPVGPSIGLAVGDRRTLEPEEVPVGVLLRTLLEPLADGHLRGRRCGQHRR